MKRILGLDLLRFITALAILSYHYFFIGPLEGYYSWQIFKPIAFWGQFGVDIFFIISGFVILFSTERIKDAKKFLISRAIRIYPAFIICSIFTLAIGVVMPGTHLSDLVIRWINSLTFYEDLWGISPLSSIYWTLMIEVKFYILTAIIMKLKIWDNNKYKILLTWLSISLLNNFVLHNNIIEMLLLTKFAGHFTLGIILYINHKKEHNKLQIPLFILSTGMIFQNMLSYTNWIRSIFNGLNYTNLDILLGTLIIISIIYLSIKKVNYKIPTNIINLLGAWSFTLYLVHADFGFFVKTKFYSIMLYGINLDINDKTIMWFAIIFSLSISYIMLKIINYITPKLKQKLIKT